MNRKWVAVVAVTGTAVIGVGAFWLSFRALSDLAGRAGVPADQGWVWAAIVDGVIVTSTVAAVALDKAGWRAVWFAWLLLALSAGVSVVANVVHAVVMADGTIDPILVGAIAAVPPLVLLAMTHLTVIVVRHAKPEPAEGIDLPEFLQQAFNTTAPTLAAVPAPSRPRRPTAIESGNGSESLRVRAAEMLRDGVPKTQIARELGVHRATIGRWFGADTSETNEAEADPDE